MDTQNLNVKCDTNTNISLGLFRSGQPLQFLWGERFQKSKTTHNHMIRCSDTGPWPDAMVDIHPGYSSKIIWKQPDFWLIVFCPIFPRVSLCRDVGTSSGIADWVLLGVQKTHVTFTCCQPKKVSNCNKWGWCSQR